MEKIYNKYSDYLLTKYGEKVYKLPIKLKGTCPNRDGCISTSGCAFCGEEGGSFENLSDELSIAEQLKKNRKFIEEKYNAHKFIAYFQNYTNTYMDFNIFKENIIQASNEEIVGIYISTRPDCVTNEQLEFLRQIKQLKKIDIVLELGLQTVNYKTLYEMNRGHSLAEFIDCVNRCKFYNIDVCTHVIIGLPDNHEIDVIETAKVISALKVDQVKIHALYLIKDTKYGKMFLEGKLHPITLDEYIENVISFLRYLSPDIVVQRLIGRSPEDRSLFSNWSCSWWKINDMILSKMSECGYKQGDLFNYLVSK